MPRRSMRHGFASNFDWTRNARRTYLGLSSFTDYLIGILVTPLKNAGLSENTRVIYTSDHGEMLGNHGPWTKFQMYEDAVSAPLIVSGPAFQPRDRPRRKRRPWGGRVVSANAG